MSAMLGAEYPATCHHRLAGTATNSEVPPSMRSCPSSRTWAGRGCIWSLARPIIKLLWTSSFVLVAGGFSLLALLLVGRCARLARMGVSVPCDRDESHRGLHGGDAVRHTCARERRATRYR